MSNFSGVEDDICRALCGNVITKQKGDTLLVSLPMKGRDGDRVTAFVQSIPGGWRVSDMGTTLMRLSYENDLSKLLSGPRADLMNSVLSESGLKENDGLVYVDVAGDRLIQGIFSLAQGVVRLEDLGLWTQSRTESTFYDDLRQAMEEIVPRGKLFHGYAVPGVEKSDNYIVDFMVQTPRLPLFVFGVNSRDKARLATITIQHIERYKKDFDSLIICSRYEDIPRSDMQRLMVAANDVVPEIAERGAIAKKIDHRMAS